VRTIFEQVFLVAAYQRQVLYSPRRMSATPALCDERDAAMNETPP
jgi:hypothetical protein